MNLIKNTLLGVLFLQLLVLLYIKVLNNHTTTKQIKKEIAVTIQPIIREQHSIKKKPSIKNYIATYKNTKIKSIELEQKKTFTLNRTNIKYLAKLRNKYFTLPMFGSKYTDSKEFFKKSIIKTDSKQASIKNKSLEKLPDTNTKIEKYAKKFLGNKYVWGATGPKTFDCSGFTQAVYKKCVGIHIPRVSRNQAKVGKYIKFSELKKGDMVFFDTSKKHLGKVNHVGIYLSDGNFIHASSGGKRVMITNFNKKRFYKNRFLWGRRIIQEHTTVATLIHSKQNGEGS